MKIYQDLLENILLNGKDRGDRTGTGTRSLFSPPPLRFNLQEGFPLITTKDMMKERKNGTSRFSDIFHELMFFIKGETNLRYLLDRGVNIWNSDAYRVYKSRGGRVSKKDFIQKIKEDSEFSSVYGDMGPIYGSQWVNFNGEGHNQLKELIHQIKENPESRRMVVSSWNPSHFKRMVLPPCHWAMECYVEDGKLSLKYHQR